MKMISTTRRQNSLSLSGGHIVSDSLNIPSYSPNAVSSLAQPFDWDDAVDDVNTPDIDPSFFDNGPFFKKYNSQTSLQMEQIDAIMNDEGLFNADQTSFTTADDTNQQSMQHSLEDNFDLSQLINQTTVDIKDSQSMVSPNDVLENHYIPTTTAPVLHYLEPRPVESIATTVDISFINDPSLIDSLTSQSTVESFQFSSPPHMTQTYSPTLPSTTQSYASPSPSPALSYTSTTSQSTLVSAMDGMTSDTNTIDSLIETKPEPEFLQPTVINDHLYTRPQTSKRRKTTEKPSARHKNNAASKKSRVTKRDKQKGMEEQIQHYIEDNARCKEAIQKMEKEIEWCKNFLFKKVTSRT